MHLFVDDDGNYPLDSPYMISLKQAPDHVSCPEHYLMENEGRRPKVSGVFAIFLRAALPA